jgi:hypothetical protein
MGMYCKNNRLAVDTLAVHPVIYVKEVPEIIPASWLTGYCRELKIFI